MPAAEPPLPEGTDTIIPGAGLDGDGDTGAANSATENPTMTTNQDRPQAQGAESVRESLLGGFATLRGQAGDSARNFAEAGRERATSALDDVVRLVEDAAEQIDERLGTQYGDYARRAAQGIGDFSDGVRGKDVDALFDDARNLVKSSPAIAIGAAALLGFVVARLARAGVPDTSGPSEDAPTA